jgi:hypothetical protein
LGKMLSTDSKTYALLLFPAVLGDVHNFVFEDEQIGRALAGQPHHVLVVVLDPAPDHLPIHQFDRDGHLFLPDCFEKCRFLEGVFWRRRPATLGIGIPLSPKRHAGIVHKEDRSILCSPLESDLQ